MPAGPPPGRRCSGRHFRDMLDERERRIVTSRLYGNQTQSEIADQVGVSQMHVSRLLSRALIKLRGQLGTI